MLEHFKKGKISENLKYDIILYGSLIVILPVIGGFFKYAMRKLIITTSRKIEFDMKNELYAHYQKLSLSFYQNKRTGDLMTRLTEDTSMIRQYMGPGLMYLIHLPVIILMVGVQMIRLDKTLGLYVLCPLPVLLVILYLMSTSVYKKSMGVQAQQSIVSSFVQDAFAGICSIKSFASEEYFQKEHYQMIEDYQRKNLNLARFNAMFYSIILWFTGLSQLLILYIGGKRYLSGEISDICLLAEFFVYINILNWPFMAISWVLTILQRAEASQNRIDEFLQISPEIVSASQAKPNIQGGIRVKNLSFAYPGANRQILENLSFDIRAGENIAIIGESGAGKSTLAQLLMRLYEPTKGNIFIDETDLKNLNLEHFRKHAGYAPQESFLFSDTIYNNIAFGKPTASKEEVYEAAKGAMIEKDIFSFKEKYNTLIGEQGVTLSGGQKQRLCIARTLIKRAKILLFDDSLSAVDQYTKKTLLQEWKRSQKNQTRLFITHDTNIAENAERILVLKKGRLVEYGNHKDLLLQKGYYYELYQKQNDRNQCFFSSFV